MLENRSQLKEIKICGYKSLGTHTQPIELKLNDLNIIIGANGAGKSNFISFFQMLSNMMTGALQVYIGKNGSAESLLQFGSKRTKMISASLTFENQGFIDTYEFSLAKAVNDTLVFTEETITDGDRNLNCTVDKRRAFCSQKRHFMQVRGLFGLYFPDARSFGFMIHPQKHILEMLLIWTIIDS